ncbi:alpha/beta hydrolase [Dokdonia sp. Dokd-P16]|uniref:alpha/beta fold hydrolase n=1 Tax=Dokdonia sp. Dokd-P16 TaxID=2173169 RepID=UPI000D549F98|nr:alpha/beta fold hydrolase [Dokdonia sp. Dokd-P16]AWH74076.1 alpha/beta hydrolase [Dokdonia sp. Dokd-P16]
MLHSNIIGEGEPLIILHGFLGMGDNWKTLAKQFAGDGFQVHLIDQRNHGRSFHSDAFSYELMVEDLKSYCVANGLEEFHLLGHSMGGKVAMLYAATHPDMVKKLIIADIGVKEYPQHHQIILEGLTALSNDVQAMTSRSGADDFLSRYITDDGTRMFLLKNLYWKEKGVLGFRMNLKALIENIEQIGKALPVGASYEGEVLFLRGDRSNYILDEDEKGLYNAFAKAQLITISNAGHWLHAENPKDFYKEVINFL